MPVAGFIALAAPIHTLKLSPGTNVQRKVDKIPARIPPVEPWRLEMIPHEEGFYILTVRGYWAQIFPGDEERGDRSCQVMTFDL